MYICLLYFHLCIIDCICIMYHRDVLLSNALLIMIC
jgi:hypothetical protein